MKARSLRSLTLGALIAALYVALTLVSASLGLAIGPFELRFSEALCILPVFFPAAVPGLTVGCLLANLLCGGILVDMIFGTLATFLGALGTYFLRGKKFWPFLPPILMNTLIVPPVLYFAYGFQESGIWFLFFSIFVGEVLSAGVLGFFVKKALEKKKNLFR
jgi:uncharacterized membrane protein